MPKDIKTEINNLLKDRLNSRLNYKSQKNKEKFINDLTVDLVALASSTKMPESHKNSIVKFDPPEKKRSIVLKPEIKSLQDKKDFSPQDVTLNEIVENIALMLRHGKTRNQVRSMLIQYNPLEVENILSLAEDKAKLYLK